MSGHINSSSSWKNLKSAHCKVGGQWKEIKSGYAKDNGTWKAIFSSSKVYSIIYDKSLATDPTGCLTYAGACKGFTPMLVNSNTGYVNEGSWAEGNGTLFDAIKVGKHYLGKFTEMSKNSVTASNTENYSYSYTRIPKIYQKVTKISDTKVQLDLSLDMFDGASVHPAFVADGHEYAYKYIARFLTTSAASYSTLGSFSGKTPIRDKMKVFIKNGYPGNWNGTISYWDWDLIGKLYLLSFKSFSTTKLISPSSTSDGVNGASNGYPWMWGGTKGTAYMFLGIESWGWQCLLSNTHVYGGYINVSNKKSSEYDGTGMRTLCQNPVNTNTNGVYALTCQAGLETFFILETEGGSATTGLCSNQMFLSRSYDVYLLGDGFFGFRAGSNYDNMQTMQSYSRYVAWQDN